MINRTFSSRSKLAATPRVPTLKCIMASLNTLMVALPIEQVEKVIKQPTIHGSGLNATGLTHYAGQAITVIDLEQRLFANSGISLSSQGYLIIVKTALLERLALPVRVAPTLIELPLNQLRVIPDSYRHKDTLGIASHVALIPQQNLTVFILDTQAIMAL